MEAYFLNDPRIEEWAGQIMESTFTACLLNGADSDAEYQRGCEIVEKLTSLLQGVSSLPSKYLEEGLQQILEQQLPDLRVINNFPTFRETMYKMLHEGMLKVIDAQTIRESNPLMSSSKENISKSLMDDYHKPKVYAEGECKCEQGIEPRILTNNEDLPLPCLATINTKDEMQEETKEIGCSVLSEPLSSKIDMSLEHKVNRDEYKADMEPDKKSDILTPPLVAETQTEDGDLNQVNQVPDKAERLNGVLSYIFPNVPIEWNITIENQRFLARVADFLICRLDPAHPCQRERFMKDGWKLLVIDQEDLTYPRRLEREIKNILRVKRGN